MPFWDFHDKDCNVSRLCWGPVIIHGNPICLGRSQALPPSLSCLQKHDGKQACSVHIIMFLATCAAVLANGHDFVILYSPDTGRSAERVVLQPAVEPLAAPGRLLQGFQPHRGFSADVAIKVTTSHVGRE